jgi:hypothetical protein
MNRKLTLDLDAISVKSFATEETLVESRGTVNAREKVGPACPWSQPLSCDATVHTCASFDQSCIQ